MKPDPNKRIIERKTESGWIRIHMSELKKDDCFRIFEPDGEPIIDVPAELTATQDAYCCKTKDNGFEVWGVETNLQDTKIET
jgi:hypothetical protein